MRKMTAEMTSVSIARLTIDWVLGEAGSKIDRLRVVSPAANIIPGLGTSTALAPTLRPSKKSWRIVYRSGLSSQGTARVDKTPQRFAGALGSTYAPIVVTRCGGEFALQVRDNFE